MGREQGASRICQVPLVMAGLDPRLSGLAEKAGNQGQRAIKLYRHARA
jgi:hypothetical protein